MQRHWGLVCPDGLVQCCLCFDRVEQRDLNVDENGDRWDVCKICAEQEKTRAEKKV
jgi:hypothetical protein